MNSSWGHPPTHTPEISCSEARGPVTVRRGGVHECSVLCGRSRSRRRAGGTAPFPPSSRTRRSNLGGEKPEARASVGESWAAASSSCLVHADCYLPFQLPGSRKVAAVEMSTPQGRAKATHDKSAPPPHLIFLAIISSFPVLSSSLPCVSQILTLIQEPQQVLGLLLSKS